MELEKSFLYTHLGHSVYSDIEKIDNAIDLIIESMIAYKDNELKKLRVGDVSSSFCEKCNPNGIVDGNIIKCKTCGRGLALIEQNAY
jgi:hypothetical protein